MLGKFFGSEFGKGFVAGTAKGFTKGFQDDIDRTKDNVDRLVLESYKGGVESKKEFDRVYKDNRKIVDQIIANLGGAQGADNPDAIYAARGLIADQGLNGALDYSTKLASHYQDYNYDPIKMLQMGKKTNHSTPMTADLLTKSTVPPISIPNVGELAKDADVGIMKFFGKKDYTSSQVESQSKALMRARGIDLDQGDLDLPPAVSVKIDPLIAGMKSNPIDEKIRLQVIYENTDKTNVERLGLIKNMMNVQNNIINRIRKEKETRLPGPLNEQESSYYGNLATKTILDRFGLKASSDLKGQYVLNTVREDRRKLILSYTSSVVQKLNDAANKGLLSKQGNFYTQVIEAIVGNKNLVVVDGLLTTGDGTFFKENDLKILTTKGNKLQTKGEKAKITSMTQTELISYIKGQGRNSINGQSGYNQLVTLIANTKNIPLKEAMKEATLLIK